MTIDQKKLKSILSDMDPLFFGEPEVVTQFKEHQRFLISGLDNKEEFRSRLAFCDAYKDEFEKLHAKLRDVFGLKPGDNEFDYLATEQFRALTNKGKSVVFDMMKDYMSYKHQKGELSDAARKRVLDDEPPAERKFREQELTDREKSFMIDQSAISEEKKNGLRECRKWMYRNCSKSGVFNETGTKRNYIDSFGKRSVAEQINTLYQVENGYYKVTDKSAAPETAAMSDNYVPTLDGFKKKMVRGWINPYRHWKKMTGDCYYWSRMERGLNKTTEMSERIEAEYEKLKEQRKTENPEEAADNRTVFGENGNEEKLSKEIYGQFSSAQKSYFKALKEYAEEKSDKKLKAVTDRGHQIQQLFKKNAGNRAFGYDPQKMASALTLTAFTEHMEKNVRLMGDNTITPDWVEKMNKDVDLGSLGASVGGVACTCVNKLLGALDVAEQGLKTVEKVASIVGVANSAMTMGKSFFMAGLSQLRKGEAEIVKAANKKNLLTKEEKNQKDLDPQAQKDAKEAEEINAAAKISKSRNKNNRNKYIVAGTAAGISCGLGITGMATTIGLPITIAAGVVAGIGFGANYAANLIAGKNPAKKSIDSMMKMEDPDYVDGKKEEANKKEEKGKRYIDIKMDERKYMVGEKLSRFRPHTQNYENTAFYLENPEKLKDRIRVNYAVKHGCMTMYTYRDNKDKENANVAYRHIFLRDPDGPIDESNLLKPDEVSEMMKVDGKNGKERKDALKRMMYYNLMNSEGRKISAPENVTEAQKMFTAKDPEEVAKEKAKESAKDPLEEGIKEAERVRSRMDSVKKDTLRAGKEAAELLERLNRAGEGKDKEGYQKMKQALTAAAKLNGDSTPREVRTAMRELQEAGEAYHKSHNGIFQGIVGSGKERSKLAQQMMEMGRYNQKVFAEKSKGMDGNESIDASIRSQQQQIENLKKEKAAKKAPDAEKKTKIKEGAQKRTENRQKEQPKEKIRNM